MIKRVGVILWFWAPVVLWAAIIYFSSSICGEDLPVIDIPNIDKFCHFVEYFILAALISRAIANSSGRFNFKMAFILSVIISSSYGALDEYHQRFVSGRSPEIFDIFSDIIGAFLGALLSTYKERSSRAVNKTF